MTVELVRGHGEHLWPRPGRIFAAAPDHSFADLGAAIDTGFARWDRAHLHEFELADGTRIGMPDPEWQDDEPVPDRPLPYFGWGAISDQYGRAWSADDGVVRVHRGPTTLR